MSVQANIDVVKQCYDAFKRGDIQGVLDRISTDIDWELPLLEGVAFSGKRRGRDQVAQFFRQLAELQDVNSFEPKEYIAQGERVVVLGSYGWTVKATHQRFDSDWMHVFTVRNGKIAAFREFMDTYQAMLAYQPQMLGARAGATATAGGRPPVH